ncbi:MFS transporter [Arthrobacter sp. NPDC080031]|uniref:MFS transporter n=1 Tax=Arthrobacter sp. NPDC080031 TaxID=3155918 RepID=UPI00344E0304
MARTAEGLRRGRRRQGKPASARGSLFALRDFRLFVASTFTASMGAWLFRVVQDLVALELTHSITAVGLVTACQFGPTCCSPISEERLRTAGLALGPCLLRHFLWGGGALGLLLPITSGTLTMPGLVVSALCFGVATALDIPLRQATIADVVPLELLRPALGVGSVSQQIGRLAGPSLGGLLILAGGYSLALWFSVGFMASAAVAASQVMRKLLASRRRAVPAKPTSGNTVRVRDFTSDQTIRFLLVLAAVCGVLAYNFSVLLIARAVDLSPNTNELYAFLNTIIAVGSIIGATLAGRMQYGARGVLVFAVGLGTSIVLIGVLSGIILAGLATLGLGICSMAYAVGSGVTIQSIAPREVRGRILSLQTLLLVGSTPFGSPLLGWFIDAVGTAAALAAVGCTTVVLALLALLVLPPARMGAPLNPARKCLRNP